MINILKEAILLCKKNCKTGENSIPWLRTTGYLSQVLNSVLKDAEIEELNKKMDVMKDVIRENG